MESDGMHNHEDYQREVVIWGEDFANGIPADWVSEAMPELAVWEYRGQGTTPSSDWGTRGSCLAEDVVYGDPIDSPTRENGFIIFDSNYWDDNIGPCGNFGAGPAPGPHLATLTTPVIDLSSYEQVGLKFHQYAKNYQADMYIEYTLNGTDWMDLWVSDVQDNSGESEPNRFDRINVSEVLGGESSVQLRIVFDGNYYFWMLDDIELFELESYNLFAEKATYGNFDLTDQGNETGWEDMEYSVYPQAMAPRVHFSTCTWNWGAEDLTGCNLEGVLRNEVTMDTIFSDVSNSMDLGSDEFFRFNTDFYDHDGELGLYTTHFAIGSDQEDDSPDNNTIIKDFIVSDFIYARDRLSTDGIYIADDTFSDEPYEVGNMYVITTDDQSIESISLGVGVGSDPDVSIYAAVYKMNISGSISAIEVANTGEFGIVDYAYNNIDDNNIMTVPFPEPVPLMKDSAYLVVAGTADNANTVFWPVSGTSEDLTSFVRFFPSAWFYLNRTPMIRANFGPVVNVEEVVENDLNMNCFPNPANAILNVTFDHVTSGRARIEVFDELGKMVETRDLGNLPKGEQRHQLNTDAWSEGWYVVSIVTEYTTKNEVVVIQR